MDSISLTDVPLWITAIAVYALGLVILKALWRLEIYTIGTPVPIATIFLAVQHHAFVLGGVLLAATAEDASFATGIGRFPVTIGLERLLWMELLSVLCAYLGVGSIAWLRSTRTAAVWRRSTSNPDRGDVRQECFLATVLTTAYAISVVVAWLSSFYIANPWIDYALSIFTFVLPGSFLMAGRRWGSLSRRQRTRVLWMMAALALFGVTQGSRALWFWPGGLLVLGYVMSAERDWRRRARAILASVLLLGCFAVMGGMIVPIRTDIIGERHRVGLASRIDLVGVVLSNLWEGYGGLDWKSSVRIFSERIVEEPVRVAMGVEIPAAGWPDGSWPELLWGLLPQQLFPTQSVVHLGPYFLADYGYAVVPGDYIGIAFGLFADAWRRFREVGVAMIFGLLGVFLGMLSRQTASYGKGWRGSVFGSLVAYGVAYRYTLDIMRFWAFVSHAVLESFAWVWVIGLILMPRGSSVSNAGLRRSVGSGVEQYGGREVAGIDKETM